ncbi:MAG: type III-B CRISPR module RAMP protein Cmr6 [Candidatus Aerophobetes bacterium]|nr:type III-B CRISPR module RAMP protein Cmr6 [Candidatus Aerophobetes bacterium]
MIRHERIGRNRKETKESRQIIVPGVKPFDYDGLYNWLKGIKQGECVNLSLLFYKFPRWFKNEKNGRLLDIELSHKFEVPRHKNANPGNPKDYREQTHDYKREHFEDIAELNKSSPPNYELLKKRHFFNEKYCFPLYTRTRLIVGFSGGNSVLEVGLSLHPLYGFPIIPGSALKGIARHYAKHYCKEKELDENTILDIFGTEDEGKEKKKEKKEGRVIFMDAWPEKWPEDGILTLDIMTPHYAKYYQDKKHRKPPSDDENPVPILFIAVKRGIEFRFCVLPTLRCEDKNLVNQAKNYLISALKEYGIGAKTGSSYGYFNPSTSPL